MSETFNVAVVGATGVVGETMLELLADRDFPVAQCYALASEKSLGKRVMFRNKSLAVDDLAQFDFKQADIALFSAGSQVSEHYAPKAAAAGCVVIDNTSCFRQDEKVPLVVPEVNLEALSGYTQRNIIANPNCSTIQMLVALKPLYDVVGVTQITVATYQAVSGAGRQAVLALAEQSGQRLSGQDIKANTLFDHPIAFNAIPQIDCFMDNGYTREEMKMVWETRKILQDDDIIVNPTAVRIPVFFGHSEAIHIVTREPISADAARQILEQAPGVKVIDTAMEQGRSYPTAMTDGANTDAVYVGRVRETIGQENGLNLWVVSDNVRKGGALNSVQLAEHLVDQYLRKPI